MTDKISMRDNHLLLKFSISLEDQNIPGNMRYTGPLFHRWLPDGKKDAVILETDDSEAELKVWFEKEGFAKRTFPRPGQGIDSDHVISKIGKLDAGSLKGLLTITNLSHEEMDALRENRIGDEIYLKLGKRIVKKLIYKPVNSFLNLLRVTYGQYWIKELRVWDSRFIGLGHYCKLIYLQWRFDENHKWVDFVPENGVAQTMTITIGGDFSQYLTQTDWWELAERANNYSPSLAATILSRSHQLLDQGEARFALIEAVTAFEISANDYLRNKLSGYSDIDGFINKFDNKSNSEKIKTFSAFLSDDISITRLEDCLMALDWRNKIVHEGYILPENANLKIKKLLETVGKLVSETIQKFPSTNTGNMIATQDHWDKEYRNSQASD